MSRFSELSARLAAKGAHNPDALAAYIGRKKYGHAGFAALAAAGRATHKAAHGGRAAALDGALTRAFASDLAVDGRTIVGLAVPFGRASRVSDDGRRYYKEQFAPGSFRTTIAQRGDRIRAHVQHQTKRLPIGKASHLEETPEGLVSHLRVSNTTEGNDTLELVKDGVLTGLSIGFKPIRSDKQGDVTVRQEVALSEISVVADPAYPDARIQGVRSLDDIEFFVDRAVRELFASRDVDPAILALPSPMEGTDDPRESQSDRSRRILRIRADAILKGVF